MSLSIASLIASTDLFACVWPISPANRSRTNADLPSRLCAPAAVIGLPHVSITYWTCSVSLLSLRTRSS
ncbi:Uncharacterised protein [Mycobacteroides abscessus subsp. abscessus]|nr:Uncharacterised protein [Mycobacteroides abscessus subsp. abscessus]